MVYDSFSVIFFLISMLSFLVGTPVLVLWRLEKIRQAQKQMDEPVKNPVQVLYLGFSYRDHKEVVLFNDGSIAQRHEHSTEWYLPGRKILSVDQYSAIDKYREELRLEHDEYVALACLERSQITGVLPSSHIRCLGIFEGE